MTGQAACQAGREENPRHGSKNRPPRRSLPPSDGTVRRSPNSPLPGNPLELRPGMTYAKEIIRNLLQKGCGAMEMLPLNRIEIHVTFDAADKTISLMEGTISITGGTISVPQGIAMIV